MLTRILPRWHDFIRYTPSVAAAAVALNDDRYLTGYSVQCTITVGQSLQFWMMACPGRGRLVCKRNPSLLVVVCTLDVAVECAYFFSSCGRRSCIGRPFRT